MRPIFLLTAVLLFLIPACSPQTAPADKAHSEAAAPAQPAKLGATSVQGLPWQPLCDNPDNPQARPAPWNQFGKATPLQRCAACANLPGNHVDECNPGNWDCAASTIFAPATGGSCDFNSCPCPSGD